MNSTKTESLTSKENFEDTKQIVKIKQKSKKKISIKI